jgi:uncharacterized protein
MNCPVCNVTLTMTDRQGVEIDYCQKCRGVWLDRGELDKIIERSMGSQPQYSSEPRYEKPREQQHYKKDDDHYKKDDDHYYKKKKKESFLGNLFDF